MDELGIFVAVGALVLFALVRGYTTKALSQKRMECGSRIAEERGLRQEREQGDILVESADARRYQTQYEVQKFTEELEGLAAEAQEIEEQLPSMRDDEGRPIDLPPPMYPHPELGCGCDERFWRRFGRRWFIAE